MNIRKGHTQGFITVEAIISLSTFMFAMFTILSIINICMIQAKVSVAINATAKELSQYSYLYSLTGFNESTAKFAQNSEEQKKELNSIMGDINTVFNEIQQLGTDAKVSDIQVSQLSQKWEDIVGHAENIEAAGSSLEASLTEIAEDPKQMIFGIAKLCASQGLELAKSRLVAAPLAKILCKKHLVDQNGGDVEAYLKGMGVVPGADGKYLNGLDFSYSTLFPYGSNEITVNVSYDVKVVALLPVDWSFHFNQTAITHGWLAGEVSFQSREEVAKRVMESNGDSLWISTEIENRFQNMYDIIKLDMEDEGYSKVSGISDVHFYSSGSNEFVKLSTYNPLWTPEGDTPLTVEDISEDDIRERIEQLCADIKSSTERRTSVTVKEVKDGQTRKTEYDCTDASNKILLVIPEDKGLKEKIEKVIAEANTRGVTVEVAPSFGKGARAYEVKEESDHPEEPAPSPEAGSDEGGEG